MKKKILILIILIILLTIIFFAYLIIKGNTYTIKVKDVANSDVEIEKEGIIKIVDKKLENGELTLKIKSISRGRAFITINNEDTEEIYIFYVHRFGIITNNTFFGDSNGDEIIPISISILLIVILAFLIDNYRKNLKYNLYQYKNIAYLGIIIFLTFSLFNQLDLIFNYNGLINTVNSILQSVNFISILLFPIALIVAVLISASNVVLIKKEGFNLKNLLGVILGLFFCFFTVFPELLNLYLYSHPEIIDVHNQNEIGYCIQLFAETTTYIIIAYLECILLATIILSVKAARRIPKFNKDYIIILGCMIKKDGTLTKLLQSRVDRAIEFSLMQKEKTGKDITFIPSGGKGKDEIIAEGVAIKNYLVAQGINEKNILVEDKSRNTLENLKFSNKLISNKKANLAFSTTNYHVFRAGIIGTSLGLKLEGIGSKTKAYFWINAFIREYIATLYSEKKKHILIILLLLINSILMITVVFISDQL